MTAWIKLHNNVSRHPKVAGLTDRAFRVWIDSLCYCSEFLTDGALPPVFLTTVVPKVQDELIRAGLWGCTGGTTTVHDYLVHQSSRATVEHERRRNRGRRTENVPRLDIDSRGIEVHPPNPPANAGGAIRVRREHKDQAKLVLRSRQGYCQHDPQCPDQFYCLDVIAREIAQKGIA